MKNLLFVIFLLTVLLTGIAAYGQEIPFSSNEKSEAIFPMAAPTEQLYQHELFPYSASIMFDTNGDDKLEVVFVEINPLRRTGLASVTLLATDVTISIMSLNGTALNSVSISFKADVGHTDGGFITSRISDDQFQCDLVIVTSQKKIIVEKLFRGEKKS